MYILFSFVVIGVEVTENFIVSYATDSTSLYFEHVFYFILAVIWISIHLILVVGARFQWFYQPWDKVHKLDDEASQSASKDYKAINIEGEDDDSEEDDDSASAQIKNTKDVTLSDGNQQSLGVEMGVAV
jgi:hypothetical protein